MPQPVRTDTGADSINYSYRGTCVEVHDGDTIRVMLDLGFGSFQREWIRFNDLYAPELSEPGGHEAKMAMVDIVFPKGKPVWLQVKTFKTKNDEDLRSFIRYVAEVWRVEPDGSLMHIADRMRHDGHDTRAKGVRKTRIQSGENALAEQGNGTGSRTDPANSSQDG